MVGRGIFAILLGASWLLAGLANANEAVTASASLADSARAAARNFRPLAPQDVARAKSELAAAMSNLDAFLRTGAAYKADGWKRHLQWNELLAIAHSDQPATPEQLGTLRGKLRANHRGLERPEFARLRDAVSNYAAATRAATNQQSPEEYARRMEDLAAQLEVYARDRSSGDAARSIARTLGWLETSRQAPELVASIRQAYGRPNLFGYASRRFAAAGIERPVDQVTAVRDNILGTDLHGTARLVGHTTLSLNENPNMASINILLGGTAWSNNVGYNGPVTIHSTGVTSVSARKSIIMNEQGMFGYASQAWCCTRSTIYDICAHCGLIERIAWRRAGQQKGQAEAIASQHAGWRVAGQMDRESGRLIAEQNYRYRERFRNPLTRRNEFPEELAFSSTRDRIQMRMLQASAGMLGAPDEPPGFSKDHDLAVRAHESVVNNYAQGVLGGFELTDVRLEKLIRDELKAELTDELRVTRPDGTLDPDKEPWSIIFAKEQPVRAKFADGGVWIGIRADGFTRGEGEEPGKYKPAITELVEISAAYKIEKTDQGATLRRDGDVQVRFPDRANPEQITVRDSPIVTFIRRKFRSLFKEEFVGEGLVFKGQWERAGRLQLSELAADQAWLTLGWDMPSAAATAAASAERPGSSALAASE
jgi:hypothetical protein